MVRVLDGHSRSARSLALRRRVVMLWSCLAFAGAIMLGAWNLATPAVALAVDPSSPPDASLWSESCTVVDHSCIGTGPGFALYQGDTVDVVYTITGVGNTNVFGTGVSEGAATDLGLAFGCPACGTYIGDTGTLTGAVVGYHPGGPVFTAHVVMSGSPYAGRTFAGITVTISLRLVTWGTYRVAALGPQPTPAPSPSPPCYGRAPSWFVGLPGASDVPCESPPPSSGPPATPEECGGLPPGLPHDYYFTRGYDVLRCSSSYVPALCYYYNDSGTAPWGNARQRVCDPGEAPGSYSWGWCSDPLPSGETGIDPLRPCLPGERPSWWGNGTGLTPAGQNIEYWPLSGSSCVGGKPGYATLGAVVDVVFPGLTLDLGAYVEWVGQLLRWGVGTLQNVLTSLYDVAADLAVPCPATLGGTFGDFTDTFRGGPFGGVGSTADAVNGALAGGPGVPFQSFSVMGHTVHLPLAAVAGDAAPVRPYLVPVVWFAVALRALGMLSTTMKGPQPTGQLTFGM